MIALIIIYGLLNSNVNADNIYLPGNCVLAKKECPNSNITFWLYTRQTQHNPYELNVRYPESIFNSVFIPDVPVIILIHGYTGHRDFSPNPEIRPAYFERGDINIITVDYMALARDPCYIPAVLNVPTIGKCCAQLIDDIVTKKGIPLDRFHVIGFSLGAQISGEIANHLQVGQLQRITGLDPAMPLFTHPDNKKKLDKGDANFVQIIHTDALQKGKFEATAHADFYVNGGMEQPGCDRENMSRSSCNHWRAVAYFAESINSKKGFYGMKCSSWFYYMLGWCRWNSDSEELLMGEYTPATARGLYFVKTNDASPYARGPNGEQTSRSEASFEYQDLEYFDENSNDIQ